MLRCHTCKKTIGKLGDMHECTDGQLRFCLSVEDANSIMGVAQGPPVLQPRIVSQWNMDAPWGAAQPVKPLLPYAPRKQRGGVFIVNGWLALAILALAAAEAGLIHHLYKHRPTDVSLPSGALHRESMKNSGATSYLVGCGVLANICWART